MHRLFCCRSNGHFPNFLLFFFPFHSYSPYLFRVVFAAPPSLGTSHTNDTYTHILFPHSSPPCQKCASEASLRVLQPSDGGMPSDLVSRLLRPLVARSPAEAVHPERTDAWARIARAKARLGLGQCGLAAREVSGLGGMEGFARAVEEREAAEMALAVMEAHAAAVAARF